MAPSPADESIAQMVIRWLSAILLFTSLMYTAYTHIINLNLTIGFILNKNNYQINVNNIILISIIGIILLVYMKFLTDPYFYFLFLPSSIALIITNFYIPDGTLFMISFGSIILLLILHIVVPIIIAILDTMGL